MTRYHSKKKMVVVPKSTKAIKKEKTKKWKNVKNAFDVKTVKNASNALLPTTVTVINNVSAAGLVTQKRTRRDASERFFLSKL